MTRADEYRIEILEQDNARLRVRVKELEEAFQEVVDGTMPWADGKQRVGYYHAIDYQEHARRALGKED